jgi:hypothetical protein
MACYKSSQVQFASLALLALTPFEVEKSSVRGAAWSNGTFPSSTSPPPHESPHLRPNPHAVAGHQAGAGPGLQVRYLRVLCATPECVLCVPCVVLCVSFVIPLCVTCMCPVFVLCLLPLCAFLVCLVGLWPHHYHPLHYCLPYRNNPPTLVTLL